MIPTLLLALRNLVRNPIRSAIAIFAIGSGVIFLTLSGGFIEWLLFAMRESSIQYQSGHVQIVKSGYQEDGMARPFSFLMPNAPDVIGTIEQMKGVKSVSARMSFNGLVSHDETTVSFVGEGMEPAKDAALANGENVLEGTGLSEKQPSGIMMGTGLAENLGVKVGAKVVLLANTATGGINAVETELIGIFSIANKAYDDVALRVPLPLARTLLKTEGAHKWVVLLSETAATQPFMDALEQRLAGKNLGFQLVSWRELNDFYNKTVRLFAQQMGVLTIIIAVIIVLGISNTLIMTVADRTSEIGTLMAIGLRRRDILFQFCTESFALGVIGGVLGGFLSVVLGRILSYVGIPMPPAPGMSEGYTAEILVTFPLLLKGLLLAPVTSLLAGIIPAWKASRLVIVDAIRTSR